MTFKLDWDDFEDETPAVQAAVKSLESLDLTEANKELEEKAEQLKRREEFNNSGLTQPEAIPLINPGMSVGDIKSLNNKLMERAKAAIIEHNKHMESGGRVDVSDKWILNCQADLNQLVPFKYSWAWSLYLTACGQHWMPAELDMRNEYNDFNSSSTSNTSRRILLRGYLNYITRLNVFKDFSLLNCYRMITNPECRQYILRQTMEIATLKHFWTELNMTLVNGETSVFKTILPDGTRVDESIKDLYDVNRHKVAFLKDELKFINDTTSSTKSEEGTREFVKQLVLFYLGVNWISPLSTYYQMINNHRKTSFFKGTAEGAGYLLRDIQPQVVFSQTMINTILEENPYVLTEEFISDINNSISSVITLELNQVLLCPTDATELLEVEHILTTYTNEYLNAAGIPSRIGNIKPNPNTDWFKSIILNMKPHVDLEAGLSGQGGALQF